MEPILTGLTTKLLYDVLARGVSVARADSVADRVTRAAETVAAEHSELEPEDLVDALTDDTVGECVERFERGEPLRVTEIAEAFREQAAATHVDAGFGADTETVVREFVHELQRELAHEPAVWRAMALREIKRGTRDRERLTAAVKELGERLDDATVLDADGVDDATVVDVDALATAVEQTRAQGFEWVTAHDFETGRVDDDYCWRRSFTLGEAWAGYPLERERPLAGDTDERQDLTDQLLDTLADGGGAALLGAPGSGKTTATRTAMAEWIRRHDGGTVFYRRKGVQTPVDHERLREEIETARENGPVLVAVEDAARRGSSRVFETVADFESDDDVSFLVNSREEEWTDTGDGLTELRDDRSARAEDVEATRTEYLEPVYVPPLDAREVERFVENYRAVTGSDGDAVDGAALLSQIRSRTGISPMLLLAYHVPVWGDEIGEHTGDEPALVENVREVFDAVHGEASDAEIEAATPHERALVKRVALAVNVLNAAEVPVREEFLLALGAESGEYETVQAVAGRLQGPLLFEEDDRTYATHHPLWSRLYLSEHLERYGSGESAAIEAFETVLNALFRLIDDEERRDAIREVFRDDTELLREIEEDPATFGHELVTKLFEIGENRPELQPLYGTTEYSQIELPAVCGARTEVKTAFSRSWMFNRRGESDRELAAVETAGELAEEAGIDDGSVLATYYLRRGHHAKQQGELDEARDYYERAREAAPDNGGENEAVSHSNLGDIDLQQGAYREAENHYREFLRLSRENSDRGGEAKSLGNLGLVAQSLGEYERARQRHQESLALEREIGNRAAEAASLGNLGSVALRLSNYERARERHQESLSILREIGDRRSEVDSLNDLGVIAQSLGEYERAQEYFRESLKICREIGDRGGEANSLSNLGGVAQHLGEYERARERQQESLEISREIGDRGGEANSLNNLGLVAQRLGEHQRAKKHLRESLTLKREIGDRNGEASSLGNLGLVAQLLGEYEQARARHQESLEISREIGDRNGEAASLTNLGNVEYEQENYRAAIENYSDAVEVFRDIGAVRRALKALTGLSQAATEIGEAETALDACREALELIEQSDLDGLDDWAREFRRRAARLDDSPRHTLDDADDATPRERYRDALVRINSGDADPETVLTRLRRAWTAREPHDAGTDAHAAATAAGVALAAYHDLLAPAQLPADPDRETILSAVDPAAVRSDAVRAVYDHLAGDEPAHTLDELDARVDTPVGDDRAALETLVFARLLRALAE